MNSKLSEYQQMFGPDKVTCSYFDEVNALRQLICH